MSEDNLLGAAIAAIIVAFFSGLMFGAVYEHTEIFKALK